MKLRTLHFVIVFSTLLTSSLIAQQTAGLTPPTLEDRISTLEQRVQQLENLIAELTANKTTVKGKIYSTAPDSLQSDAEVLTRKQFVEKLKKRKLELRIGYDSNRADARKVTIESTGEIFYVSEENVVTGRSIVNTRLITDDAGNHSISLIALGSAEKQIQEVTKRNIGNYIVIMIDGVATYALKLNSSFDRHFQIDAGNLSKDELEKLMHSMYGNGI